MAGPGPETGAPPPPEATEYTGSIHDDDNEVQWGSGEEKAFERYAWNSPREQRLAEARDSGRARQWGRAAVRALAGSGEVGSRSEANLQAQSEANVEAPPMPEAPDGVRIVSRKEIEKSRVALELAQETGADFVLVPNPQIIENARRMRDEAKDAGVEYKGTDPDIMIVDPDRMTTYADAFGPQKDSLLKQARAGASRLNSERVRRADNKHARRVGGQADRIKAEHAINDPNHKDYVRPSFRNAPIGESSYDVTLEDGRSVSIQTSETPTERYGRTKDESRRSIFSRGSRHKGSSFDQKRMRAQGALGRVPGLGRIDPSSNFERRKEKRNNTPEKKTERHWITIDLDSPYHGPFGEADRAHVLTQDRPHIGLLAPGQELRLTLEATGDQGTERVMQIGTNPDQDAQDGHEYVVRIREGDDYDSVVEHFCSEEQVQALMVGNGEQLSFTVPDADPDGNEPPEVVAAGKVGRVMWFSSRREREVVPLGDWENQTLGPDREGLAASYDFQRNLVDGEPSLSMLSEMPERAEAFRIQIENGVGRNAERRTAVITRNYNAQDSFTVRVSAVEGSDDADQTYECTSEQLQSLLVGNGAEASFSIDDKKDDEGEDEEGDDGEESDPIIAGTVAEVSWFSRNIDSALPPPVPFATQESGGDGNGETEEGGDDDSDETGSPDGGGAPDGSGPDADGGGGDGGPTAPEKKGGDGPEAKATAPETGRNGPEEGELPPRTKRGPGPNRTEVPRPTIDVKAQEAEDARRAEEAADGEPRLSDRQTAHEIIEIDGLGRFTHDRFLEEGRLDIAKALESDGGLKMVEIRVNTEGDTTGVAKIRIAKNRLSRGPEDEFVVTTRETVVGGDDVDRVYAYSLDQVNNILAQTGERTKFKSPEMTAEGVPAAEVQEIDGTINWVRVLETDSDS